MQQTPSRCWRSGLSFPLVLLVAFLLFTPLHTACAQAEQAPPLPALLSANRTLTCADVLRGVPQPADASTPIIITVPTAAAGSDAALVVTCDTGSVDGLSVTFAAAQGSRLVLSKWVQKGGSVAIVPAAFAVDLTDVHVVVAEGTHINVSGNVSAAAFQYVEVHALSLVSHGGSVRRVRMDVHRGAHLTCSMQCIFGAGGRCTAASVVAAGNVSAADLSVRGDITVVNATVSGTCGAAAASVLSRGGDVTASRLQVVENSTVVARIVGMGTATSNGHAVAASFATMETATAVFTNNSIHVSDAIVNAAAGSTDDVNQRPKISHAAAASLLPVRATDLIISHVTLTAESAVVNASVRSNGGAAAAIGVAAWFDVSGTIRVTNVAIACSNSDVSVLGTVTRVAIAAAGIAGFATEAADLSLADVHSTFVGGNAVASAVCTASTAVAVGFGLASYSGNSNSIGGSTSRVVADRTTASASASTVLAESGRYGSVAAAVAIGAATYSNAFGAISRALVTDTALVVSNCVVSALSLPPGRSGDAVGSATAAVGVATGSRTNRQCTSNSAVHNTTIAAVNRARISATSGSYGSGAAAVGVAAASSTASGSARSSAVAHNSTIAAIDAEVSATTVTHGSASAAVGVAANWPRASDPPSTALSIRLCRSLAVADSHTSVAVLSAPAATCPSAIADPATMGLDILAVNSTASTSNLGIGVLLSVPLAGGRMWLDNVTASSPNSACYETSPRQACSDVVGPTMTILDSTVICARVGWSANTGLSIPSSNLTVLETNIRSRASGNRNVTLVAAFPGANVIDDGAISAAARAAVADEACTAVAFPIQPAMPSTPPAPGARPTSTLSSSPSVSLGRTVSGTQLIPDEPPPVTSTKTPLGPRHFSRTLSTSTTVAPPRTDAPTTSGGGDQPGTPTQSLSSVAGGWHMTRSSKVMTVTEDRDAPPDTQPLVERSVPVAVREVTAGTSVVTVAAVTALVPGALQPGAVGAPARLGALPQLLLCSEIEDPPLTVLPWRAFVAPATELFAQLAERAAAAAAICVALAAAGALWLRQTAMPMTKPSATGNKGSTQDDRESLSTRHRDERSLRRGVALAAFIVPAGYAGPAVSGVAAQIVSVAAQASSLDPVSADTGEPVPPPTAADLALACAGTAVVWAHLCLAARIVFARDKHSGPLYDDAGNALPMTAFDSAVAALDDFLCGRLREGPRRGWCGFAAAVDAEGTPHATSSVASRLSIRAVALIEIGTAHVFELLVGTRGSHSACVARAYAALLVTLLFLAYVVFQQPLASRLEHGFQFGLAIVQAAAAALVTYSLTGSGDLAAAAADSGEWAATAGLWLVVVQAVALAIDSVRHSSSRSAPAASRADEHDGETGVPLLAMPQATAAGDRGDFSSPSGAVTTTFASPQNTVNNVRQTGSRRRQGGDSSPRARSQTSGHYTQNRHRTPSRSRPSSSAKLEKWVAASGEAGPAADVAAERSSNPLAPRAI